jgi:hypothetical protein
MDVLRFDLGWFPFCDLSLPICLLLPVQRRIVMAENSCLKYYM